MPIVSTTPTKNNLRMSKPITFDRLIRIITLAIVFIAALALINYLSSVLLPFFIAFGIAYLLYPIVIFFQQKARLRNRVLSIVVVLLLVIGIVTGFFMLIVPSFIDQTIRLESLISSYLTKVGQNKSVPALLEEFVLPYISDYDWLNQLENGNLIEIIKKVIPGVGGVLSQAFHIVGGLVTFCVTLLYLFFILLDYEQITEGWSRLWPKHSRGQMMNVSDRVRTNMGNYFRGQSLVALCVGILFAIGFSIIDFPMAIGLGLFIGLLNLIPYLQMVGIIPTIMLALLKAYDTGGSFWLILLSALAVFAVVQTIQDMILTPRIMGKAMGLNPAMMLLSLSVWGALLGFIGLIIALPLTTLIIAYVNEWIDERDARFTDEDDDSSEF
ncbi:MAG: AI-2E family transporter [Bacteroidales bacterium]|nr:AI-2E family transporter [Bacteroidales bacterium]